MFDRIRWHLTCDRIGPDVPFTHWMLHFVHLGRWLCRRKLRALGRNSSIRPFVFIDFASNVSLGENVVVRPMSALFSQSDEAGSITIEDNVLLGMGVHVYTANHAFARRDLAIIDQGFMPSAAVRICRGAWIGAGTIILPGVTIGENAVVGAGSVVTRDVESGAVVAGRPARATDSSREIA
jgi:acetyltransferase-like isoleucine patch superfamily enzyme